MKCPNCYYLSGYGFHWINEENGEGTWENKTGKHGEFYKLENIMERVVSVNNRLSFQKKDMFACPKCGFVFIAFIAIEKREADDE